MHNLVSQKLTVCIPAYNGGAYLGESIRSVLTQSYSDFTLIVCDDCSTDNTRDTVLGFHDRRLKYVQNSEKLGLVGNWNRCVEFAEGEYLYLWHQDDVMMPDNLEIKLNVLESYPEVGFVHSNAYIINESGQTIREEWHDVESRDDYVIPGERFFRRFFINGGTVCCPSVLARIECYRRLGPFRHELPLTCDYEMWMRMSLYYDVACIGKPVIKYRWHSTNETHKFLSKHTVNGILNPRGLEQCWLARKVLLASHSHRVPELPEIKKAAKKRISQVALGHATRAVFEERFKVRWGYWLLSVNVEPRLLMNWKTIAVLLAGFIGRRGAHLAFRIKRTFAECFLPTTAKP